MTYIKSAIYFTLILLLFSSCNNAIESPYPQITFNKVSSMPGTGRASAVAFAIDGKGYVALGRTAVRSGALKDCWQYDPTLDSWSQKTDFPGTARVKATAAVINGKAYVGLGFNISLGVYTKNDCLKDFWMYNPVTDNWTQMADFPSNYSDACASFVYDNKLYVTSGFNAWDFNSETWKFDPEQGELGTWTKLKDFPGPAREGGVASAIDNHIYFGTGYWTFNANDWWEYLPASDSWKQRKSMPDNGRENAVSLSINNRIFIATGRHFGGNMTGGEVKSDIMEYNPDLNGWYKRGNIPNSGRENALSFTINGKGYIGFGENDTEILNDFWSFEP